MTDVPLRLAVIIGSTREGRVGDRIARWFVAEAGRRAGVRVSVIDLAGFAFPRGYPAEATPQTAAFAAEVERADAFVVVTPEYNYGMPAVLKNALDYLHHEWAHKPIAFVSYGGVSAGTRSVQMAKQVVTTLRMFPIPEAVSIPFVFQLLDDEQRLVPNEVMSGAAKAVLDELVAVEKALRPLRQAG
jgi:NAD(P)H-dependent FMN reductase